MLNFKDNDGAILRFVQTAMFVPPDYTQFSLHTVM